MVMLLREYLQRKDLALLTDSLLLLGHILRLVQRAFQEAHQSLK